MAATVDWNEAIADVYAISGDDGGSVYMILANLPNASVCDLGRVVEGDARSESRFAARKRASVTSVVA